MCIGPRVLIVTAWGPSCVFGKGSGVVEWRELTDVLLPSSLRTTVRRSTAAAALFLVPVLLLTGCGSSTKAKSADAASATPTVGGTFGKSATLTLPKTQDTNKQLVIKTITEGTGATIASTDTAFAELLVKDWTTGKTVSDSFSTKSPLVGSTSGMIPALKSALLGHKIGSRLLVVAPPADAASQLAATEAQEKAQGETSSLTVGATDTLAMVVDITGSVPTAGQASGAAQPAVAGMPTVDASAAKAATITIPKGAAAPTTLKTSVLVKGTGAKVASGQTIVAQYTGVTWKTGKVFDSSWNDSGAASFQIGVGAVIKGWDQALVGQTVGSRVEIVIPPSLGYGSTAEGTSIPANSTLVFVVDILAAV